MARIPAVRLLSMRCDPGGDKHAQEKSIREENAHSIYCSCHPATF